MAHKDPGEVPHKMYSPRAILKWFHFQGAHTFRLAQNYPLTFAAATHPQRRKLNHDQSSLVQQERKHTRAPAARQGQSPSRDAGQLSRTCALTHPARAGTSHGESAPARPGPRSRRRWESEALQWSRGGQAAEEARGHGGG